MTSVLVPSRTHAGHDYLVTIGPGGTYVCTCPASYNRLECWHIKYVKEETKMNDTTQALVPVKLAPPTALVATQTEMSAINQAASLALAGAIALPRELNTPQKVAAVMLYGWEMGLRPMTAIRHLQLINGRIVPSAEVMAGMLMAAEPGAVLSVKELTDEVCTMRIRRPAKGIDELYTVTWDEIKKAGLDRDNNVKYPRDRLRYHCTKRLLRIYAPEVINNIEGVVLAGAGPSVVEGEVSQSELYNEGDAPEVVAPVSPPPAAPAPAEDALTAVYMELVDRCGKDAALQAMTWAVEQYPYAQSKPGRLDRSRLDPEDYEALVQELRRWVRSGVQRCPEGTHLLGYSEDGTVLSCGVCALVVEEAEQPSLV